MPTKLSRYCEGLIEATWLAAVVIIPVFFNIYSSRIFEPDKATFLRSLVLLALGAWLIKLIEEGGVRWETMERKDSWLKTLWNTPLLAFVAALVVIYIVSTIFSVSPRVSLWGSYQRLQGTYTTISYIVLFAAVIGNLRKQSQIDRLVNTIILASLPVAFYGLLQRNQIDPVPWGGNTTTRIAANLGNSIFVAAYLIMVVPLTLGRIVQSIREVIHSNAHTISNVARTTIYLFIFALQVIAIYFSFSRGPALGLIVGIIFLVLLLTIHGRKRWLSITWLGMAVLGVAFLFVFNLEGGPLESLRTSPAIGRFGRILDTESNNALVRKYIWQGAYDLVSPHPALKFPDDSTDKFNFLRPLVGYGPEGMYVAYNQFYPPELGHVEKRNASPDRSHNETWDALVITGLSGLIDYLLLFGALFYFGLKWLGLIRGRKNHYLFFGLIVAGGIAGSVGAAIWQGIEFVGVGLPFGMLIGLGFYLSMIGAFGRYPDGQPECRGDGALLAIVLLSTFAAHFIEINFGIAIVATRTLFWVYAGLLIVVGHIMPKVAEREAAQQDTAYSEVEKSERKFDRKTGSLKRRKTDRETVHVLDQKSIWMRKMLIAALISALLLTVLGYDYINNSRQNTQVAEIMVNSLTRLPNRNDASSMGILGLIGISLLAGAILFTSENPGVKTAVDWWTVFVGTLMIGIAIGSFFWLIHAGGLASLAQDQPKNQFDLLAQIDRIGGLLTILYVFIGFLLFVAGWLLMDHVPTRGLSSSAIGLVSAPVLFGAILILVNFTNLRIIHADIAFKMAEPFANSSRWEMATLLYKRSLELAPMEDHYYLFLGRSYLEQAKTAETTEEQDALILQAEADLQVAQGINPLNTDHTANLGRLYSWWAGKATDGTVRLERGQTASEYYAMAVTLSPNNSVLWGEWAILYLQLLRQPEESHNLLSHAIEIDAEYSFTQGLMGDYYSTIARSTEEPEAQRQALQQAAFYYSEAVRVHIARDSTLKSTYLVSLGNAYIELAALSTDRVDTANTRLAINALEEAISADLRDSDLWKVQEALAKLYYQLGEKITALNYATAALGGATEASVERIQTLIATIEGMP